MGIEIIGLLIGLMVGGIGGFTSYRKSKQTTINKISKEIRPLIVKIDKDWTLIDTQVTALNTLYEVEEKRYEELRKEIEGKIIGINNEIDWRVSKKNRYLRATRRRNLPVHSNLNISIIIYKVFKMIKNKS